MTIVVLGLDPGCERMEKVGTVAVAEGGLLVTDSADGAAVAVVHDGRGMPSRFIVSERRG